MVSSTDLIRILTGVSTWIWTQTCQLVMQQFSFGSSLTKRIWLPSIPQHSLKSPPTTIWLCALHSFTQPWCSILHPGSSLSPTTRPLGRLTISRDTAIVPVMIRMWWMLLWMWRPMWMSAMLVSLESFRKKMAQTVANGCGITPSSLLKSIPLARAGTQLKTTSNGLATMRDQLGPTLKNQWTRETLIKVIKRDGTLSLAMLFRDWLVFCSDSLIFLTFKTLMSTLKLKSEKNDPFLRQVPA